MTSSLPSLIDTVKALDAKASGGKWTVRPIGSPFFSRGNSVIFNNPLASSGIVECNEEDADLIAYYRTAAPRLALECERLTEILERTEKAIRAASMHPQECAELLKEIKR